MKTTLLCLFLLIFIVSCKNDPTAKEMVVVAADDSSSISLDIEVSTHGDTPVWVGKEIPEVEYLLGVLDSVALNSISIAKDPIQSLDLKLFMLQFGLKKTDSEGILFLSEGNDSMRIVTIKERLAFLNVEQRMIEFFKLIATENTGKYLVIPIQSTTEIAKSVGATREMCGKILRILETKGTLKFEKTNILLKK